MNKEETFQRLQSGFATWNSWSKQVLAKRPADGSPQLADWHREAATDFSGSVFRETANFAGFIFPGSVTFERSEFREGVTFESASFGGPAAFRNSIVQKSISLEGCKFEDEVSFRDAQLHCPSHFIRAGFVRSADFIRTQFGGDTWFDLSWFELDANFSDAKFSSKTHFDRTEFKQSVNFEKSSFTQRVQFRKTYFRGWADFEDTTFKKFAYFKLAHFEQGVNFGQAKFLAQAAFDDADFDKEAKFDDSEFCGRASFSKTTFHGPASFMHTRFGRATSFQEAIFVKDTRFVAIKGADMFTLEAAHFSEAPDFTQAHFEEAPRLDNATFPKPARAEGEAARWRSLKRLALQGHDHDRELLFFANELRSTRGVSDRSLPSIPNAVERVGRKLKYFFGKAEDENAQALPVWRNSARFWMGLAYQWFSSFGRSMLRPLLWWAVVTLAFAGSYWWGSLNGNSCVGGGSNTFNSALYLSLNKALIFSGIGTPEYLSQSYACLYGTMGENLPPVIPDYVAFMGILQTVFSGTLIFLFLLAVRNQFRIR